MLFLCEKSFFQILTFDKNDESNECKQLTENTKKEPYVKVRSNHLFRRGMEYDKNG